MRTQLLLRLFSILACGAAQLSATAAEDYRSLSVPWSNSNAITIGSGLDVDLINQQRYTCLTVNDESVKWLDGSGPVQTNVSIELVTDYQSLAKTLDLEVDYKAKADVGIASLKAGAGVDLNMRYSSFAKNEGRTLALVVKAFSDYGRKGLAKFTLDEKFASLINAGNYAAFRASCGTHTVVAQHNQAMVAVVIQLSDISEQSKRTLESAYKSNFGASGVVSGLTVSGSTELQAKWKDIIETSRRLGSMQISFESKGGAGISDGFKLAVTADPAKIDSILKGLSDIGSSFTQASSVPVEYLLIPNSVFGAQNSVSDTSKLNTLNGYYLQLVRVDEALSRIAGYKVTFPALSAVYSTSRDVQKLRAYRNQLVAAVESCALHDDCTYTPAKDLGVLFVEDIVTSGAVKLQCQYQYFESLDRNVKLKVLNNAAVILRATARLTDYVSLPTALLTRLGPQSTPPRPMFTAWQAFRMSEPDAQGDVRILAQIDNQTFNPVVDIRAGSVTVTNEAEMASTLSDMLGSIYAITVQAKNGFFIQNAVGPAYGGECPLRQTVK